MAQNNQQNLQLLSELIANTAQIQRSTFETTAQLAQIINEDKTRPKHGTLPRALPSHYIYAHKPGECFITHIDRLTALKDLQQLDEQSFIRLIKSSLSDHARAACGQLY